MTTRFHAAIIESPLGPLRSIATDAALCELSFDAADGGMPERLAREGIDVVSGSDPLGMSERVAAYFAGRLDAFGGLRFAPAGTPFARRVWDALLAIPPGTTWSYARLAAAVGGTHARAVGGANSRNPIAIAIPCHRVIGADARLVGYAGGLERKQFLLEHELRHASALPLFAAAAR